MQLHCLRHGVTHGNVEGRFNGTRDETLTDSQARALRQTPFAYADYAAIYSSPLTRCIETARCLRIASWIPEPRLAERNLGIFEGLTADECARTFPDDFATFRRFDADFVIPRGESRAQHLGRLMSWIDDVRGLDRVLAITHGGTIDFLYRLATGRPVHGGDEIFAGANASISIFDVDAHGVRLVDYEMPLGL